MSCKEFLFGVYLLAIKRWRPSGKTWMWPDWKNYGASLKFGAQFSGTAVITAARGVLESLVLPGALGYEALGLLNRAQVLFSTTVGRVSTLVIETIYPLLPRSAGDSKQFARHATLFIQTMLLLSIPGAVFVGMEGPYLSRMLYGSKWVAADPLIWPGTLLAWGVATVLIFSTVLRARNRLRLAFVSSLIAACLACPAILVAIAGAGMQSYAWALAGGQFVATVAVITFGAGDLERFWIRRAALPPHRRSGPRRGCVARCAFLDGAPSRWSKSFCRCRGFRANRSHCDAILFYFRSWRSYSPTARARVADETALAQMNRMLTRSVIVERRRIYLLNGDMAFPDV
jgi:hypothetical protein